MSDRKASQLLGVTLTCDRAVSHTKPASPVDARRKRSRFPLRFGKDRSAVSDTPPPCSEEDFVRDEPNPFGPPDPSQEWLRALIQAEIARTRRFDPHPLTSSPPTRDVSPKPSLHFQAHGNRNHLRFGRLRG